MKRTFFAVAILIAVALTESCLKLRVSNAEMKAQPKKVVNKR